MDFGSFIRRERENRHLSLRVLGKKVGCSKQYLYCIETGEYKPTVEMCTLLALHLRLDKDAVLIKAGHMPRDIADLIREQPEVIYNMIRREMLKTV